jgi:hypothetical protein
MTTIPGANTTRVGQRGTSAIRASERSRAVRMAIPYNLLFDAPGQVDARSLTSGATGDEASLRSCDPNGEDMNATASATLVCHFDPRNAAFGSSHDEGILKGTALGPNASKGSNPYASSTKARRSSRTLIRSAQPISGGR